MTEKYNLLMLNMILFIKCNNFWFLEKQILPKNQKISNNFILSVCYSNIFNYLCTRFKNNKRVVGKNLNFCCLLGQTGYL